MSVPVLLLEDDDLLGEFLQRALELRGYEVHWFRQFNKALEEIKRVAPKVLFIDFALEEENGLKFLQYVKEDFPDSHFYLLSGVLEEQEIPIFLESGFDDVFLKPVPIDTLAELIDKADS